MLGLQWRNWIALQTSNLEVVGSNPTWSVLAVLRAIGLEV